MIDLLRRDPALRLTPLWLIFAPLFASVIEGLRTVVELRALRGATVANPDVQTALLVLALWLPLAVILMFSAGTPRCSRLDMVLPIPAPRLWAAHLIGTLGTGLLVLVASVALLELRRYLTGLLADSTSMSPPGVAGLIVPTLATLFLTVAVLQSLYPTRRRLPQTALFRVGAFVVTVLGYGLILLLTRAATGFTALPLAIGSGLLLSAWRSVPQAFTLASKSMTTQDGIHRSRHAPGAAWTPHPTAGTLRTVLTVTRILAGGIAPGQLVQVPMTWLSAPMLVAWGVLLAGFPYGSEARLFWMALASYLLFAFWPAPLNQLGQLDALPISRRRLFALLTLPGFGLVTTGYLIGRALLLQRGTQEAFVPTSAPITFAGVVLLFLVFATLYLRSFRAHISDGGRKTVYFGLIAAFVVMQIGSLVLMILGYIGPLEKFAAFETSLDHATTGNLAGTLAVWVVSAAVTLGGYTLAERQFRRIEIPTCSVARES